jgi:hypothetical protein
MNDLQFAGRYQFMLIRCSGRLISMRNEHYMCICTTFFKFETHHFTLAVDLYFYLVILTITGDDLPNI